jgi:hypothetical protein
LGLTKKHQHVVSSSAGLPPQEKHRAKQKVAQIQKKRNSRSIRGVYDYEVAACYVKTTTSSSMEDVRE